MQIDQEMLSECGWQWDEDQILLRNLPNLGDLDLLLHTLVQIEGIPYVQGGGPACFAFAWDATGTQLDPVLVETRDFTEPEPYTYDSQPYPIWENARVVPDDDRFFKPVTEILGQL